MRRENSSDILSSRAAQTALSVVDNVQHVSNAKSSKGMWSVKVPGDDRKRLSRKFHPSQPHVMRSGDISEQSVHDRLDLVRLTSEERGTLADAQTLAQRERYARNIENFIGTVKVPVGLAGPLRVNGTHAQGDYYIPLATTEAALVASYSRGAQAITRAGGCTARVLDARMLRAPIFTFADLRESTTAALWVRENVARLRAAAEATSRHARLLDVAATIEGNHLYLECAYATGEAA